MKSVKIGERIIGLDQPAYIIAEVGANHDRDLVSAHRLIDVAIDCGADAVKFQTYSAETLYSRFTPRLEMMDDFGRSPPEETPFELIKRVELPREWQKELRDHAVENGIDFLSTPFDLKAVGELAALGVKAFKIGSFELVNYGLLRAVAKYRHPLIISTGNSNLADVERAINVVQEEGNDRVVLLHCVSQYPAEFEDLNLRAMQTLAQAFDVPVGFSDHSMGNTAAVVALGLGSCCFEKHFTLGRKRNGPDHPSALEPDELGNYIQTIRDAEKALGSPVKRTQFSEEEVHVLGRCSLHALGHIPEGAWITADMLTVKRPALGIHPAYEGIVIGRTAQRDIQADEWITWDMV